MLSSGWFRLGLLLAAVALFAAAAPPAIGREPRAPGKTLVAQYQLPPDTIARYAAMAAGAAGHLASQGNTLFADRSPWIGPKHRAGAGRNPYTLVFTVSGVARAAGEVQAQWQAGWEIQESPVASREVVMAVPRVTRSGVAAGQALTLTASSSRVSFRGERHVAPMLGLVQMRNLDIHDVHLQVWSGEAAQAWSLPEVPRSALIAMGLASLFFALRFAAGRFAFTAPDPQPRVSRLPPADVIVHAAVVAGSGAAAAPLALPGPAAVPATVAPSAAVVAPAAPALPAAAQTVPGPRAQVLAALQHVLTVGLAVAAVPDRTRGGQRPALR